MADVSGPCSSLPGSSHAMPDGAVCDSHPDRPAARRIQGETDSFGAEFYELCQECLDDLRKERQEARIGCCDWCKKEATDLRPKRDFEEGMAGRVYDVCGNCVRAENKRLEEGRSYYGDDDHDD